MIEIEKADASNGNDDITIYNNPNAAYVMRPGHSYYAVAPEGCGSYGATPEEARQLLEIVREDFRKAKPEGKAAFIEQARERVEEIIKAGGRKNLDAE